MFLVEDFGIFTDRLLQIFPECVGITDMANEQKNVHEIELIGMNPKDVFLTERILEDFRKNICFRLGVNVSGQRNKILLIERLPPDEYFVSKAKRKGSGASRRSIINHAELLSTLASIVKNPFELHNLQLERISFEDQAYYFDRALVVIAQHGAGLANCIWMRRKAVVIELSEHETSNHFRNHFRIISRLRQLLLDHTNFDRCQLSKLPILQAFYRLPTCQNHCGGLLHYFCYKTNSKHATIDIEDFTSWLLKKSILKQYFQSPSGSGNLID